VDTAALPSYTLNESDIAAGASLGNSSIWVTTKANGTIERIFNVNAGETLFGTISIRFATSGHRLLIRHPDAPEPDTQGYVWLLPDAPAAIEIHPAYQRRRYVIAGNVKVAETVWVPLQELTGGADPPLLVIDVELHNAAQFPSNIRAVGFARLRGSTIDDVRTTFRPDLGALVGYNASRPELVRIFGMNPNPSKHEATFDFGRVYDRSHQHGLADVTAPHGDILAALQYDLTLQPDERAKLTFHAAAYHGTETSAVNSYERARVNGPTLGATADYLSKILQYSQVLTPDERINEGALWSKVNMRRVIANYPQGLAFTNDPGASSNVVGRDAAWFVYGNDHFLPEFSCALLHKFAELQYPNGKIPEFYNALDGSVEDDGLNINDDTPLFILAANHHHRSHGKQERSAEIYPAVALAANYIISQMDERDLVFCSAKDPRGSVWAIAGWRNIIPNYSINGATTEINAECVAALRAAGHMAENLRIPADAKKFFDAAGKVRSAMDRHLLNPDNGLYYLNIDADGNVHTDVTGDEIFPVMFRACDEATGFRIISRLYAPDFWTDAGLRTASRFDPVYHPSAYSGLIGGVWPGLTWWYAFAAASYHPELMVRALRASFEHYGKTPKATHTVPGEFGEWFDGESLVNRGMRLSPWEPPRFLWAAVEGVCGLMLGTGDPQINPIIPALWKWVALRQCPYHGSLLSYFAIRQGGELHLYATLNVATKHSFIRYDEDISSRVQCFSRNAAVVALRRNDTILILVGNAGNQTASVPLNIQSVVQAQARYLVRVYDSEQEQWEAKGTKLGSEIGLLAFSIETNGFRLLEMHAS